MSMPPADAPARSRLTGGIALVGLLTAAIAALAGVVLAAVLGFAVFVVQSPSMGRAAPVGTLVLTERVDFRDLRTGDVVTYRASGSSTTTHRIVRRLPQGLQVRGDVNGAADAVLVRPGMVVGRAVLLAPGVGWLLRLLPWTAIGLVSVWLLTWPLRRSGARAGARVIGACASVALVVLLQRPLVAWSVLTQRSEGRGVVATLIPTGLLPVRFDATGGGSTVLSPGQKADLLLPADAIGRVGFTASPGLEAWGWAVLALVCLAPLLGVLVIGLPPRDGQLVRPA